MRFVYATIAFLCCCLSFSQELPLGGIPISSGGSSITLTKCLTDGGGTLSSPYTIAVSATCAAGSTLVVFMTTRNNGDTAGTLKDSKGNCSNAYTEHTAAGWFNSTAGAMIWTCVLTSALTTSDHLTYTPTTDFSFTWQGVAVAGLTTGLDTVPTPTSNTSGSTSETSPSYTMTTANEAVCYFMSTSHGTNPPSAYGNVLGTAPSLTDSTSQANAGWGSIGCRVASSSTSGGGSITLPAASDGWIGITLGLY